MVIKALIYIFLIAIKPNFYIAKVKNNKNSNTLANISIILSLIIVFLMLLFYNYRAERILVAIIWTLGFFVGILFKIYLISMMVGKMKKQEIPFLNAKLIISFSVFPLLLLIQFKAFYPVTLLAPFYNLIFFLWYAILIVNGIVQLYSIKIIQALFIILNVIFIYFIIFLIFSGIKL